MYETETWTSSGGVTRVTEGSATLVEENGGWALFIVSVPLFVTVVVGCALCIRRARVVMLAVAWTLTGLLACFNLLAMLSIGIYIVPVTVCLAVACAFYSASPPRRTTA